MRYFALLVLAALAAPAGAATYKWVDEKGVTHYGDTLPPEYANQGSSELSKKGLLIKKTEPALTPEQRRIREEEEARRAGQEQRMLQQKRKDAALLNTFSSVEELDLARTRNLQQAEAQIQGAQLRLKSVQARLARQRAQAAALKKAGKPLPADLPREIQNSENEAARIRQDTARAQNERDAIQARFDADRQRFLELTGPSVP